MKVRDFIIILFIFFVIIIGIIIISKKRNNNSINYYITQSDVVQTEENVSDKVNIDEATIKKSVEKNNDGVEVSNVKINSINNNIVSVTLTVTNKNKKEKNVDIRVLYFDSNNNQIGENGFSVGILGPGEVKDMESTCYIESSDVANIKAKINVEKIEHKSAEFENTIKNETKIYNKSNLSTENN